MDFFRLRRRSAASALTFALACGLAAAAASTVTVAQAATNPPIRVADGIEYMCGGKGGEEAAFMRTVAPRWAAALEFGVLRAAAGEVPGEIQVLVRERYTGHLVMQAAVEAPVMLARLEPGAYEVEATLAGLTLRQPLVVFGGLSSKAVFTWPSNVDFANAGNGRRLPEQTASARLPE